MISLLWTFPLQTHSDHLFRIAISRIPTAAYFEKQLLGFSMGVILNVRLIHCGTNVPLIHILLLSSAYSFTVLHASTQSLMLTEYTDAASEPS